MPASSPSRSRFLAVGLAFWALPFLAGCESAPGMGPNDLNFGPHTDHNDGAPSAIADLRVTGATTTSLTLAFTEVHDGNGGPASYDIRYAPTPLGWGWGSATVVSVGSCSRPLTGRSSGETLTCRVEGLTAGTSYDVQLVAYRGDISAGTAFYGHLSNIATGATSTVDPTPLRPGTSTDLAISAVTSNTVELSFSEVDDGTGQPASYDVRFIATPMGWKWGVAEVASSGSCARPLRGERVGATLTCTVGGLTHSTSYDFRIVAYRGDISQGTARYGGLSNVATGVTAASPLGRLTVTPGSHAFTALGARTQLAVSAVGADGRPISNPGITWSTSDSDIATVDNEGTVTARGIGSAIISAAALCCGGDRAEVEVSQVVTQVAVSPSTSRLDQGRTTTLQAVPRDANGNVAPVAVTWSSSNSSVATVNSSGVVTAISAGQANIRASANGVRGSAAVEVRSTATTGRNEPSGYSLITNRSFNQKVEDGWGDTGSSLFSIRSDNSAPHSCCSVGQARYPQGFSGGSGPVRIWKGFSDRRDNEVYISYWVKFSENWQGHPGSGVNKIIFVWIHGNPSVVVSATGSGSNPLRPQLRLQNIPDGPANYSANVNSVTIQRGQWHHWEIQLISNSDGLRNGVGRVWIDGVLALDHRTINYASSTQSRHWENVFWNPTWGGTGDTVQNEMFMWMDHFYMSGRR